MFFVPPYPVAINCTSLGSNSYAIRFYDPSQKGYTTQSMDQSDLLLILPNESGYFGHNSA